MQKVKPFNFLLPPIKIKILSQKVSLPLLIGGLCLFFVWLVAAASRATLPDADHPLLFYSNQTRNDIKLTLSQALKSARKSIFLSVYGITDPQILQLLSQKSQNLPVSVEYDPTASSNLKKLLPSTVNIQPIKSRGLMHRKILLIDDSTVFLSSANLTPASLRHHDNLVLGIFYPPLAQFLKAPKTSFFTFELRNQRADCFLLPDPEMLGLNRLLSCIEQAKNKIYIAMFTLTHPDINEALIQAKMRGVDVKVAVDFYTARGASKKALADLEQVEIPILLSQGRELFHHKWAVIDDEILVTGSANWTKAAFTKNHDFIFFLSPLDEKQRNFLHRLWEIIDVESITNPKVK